MILNFALWALTVSAAPTTTTPSSSTYLSATSRASATSYLSATSRASTSSLLSSTLSATATLGFGSCGDVCGGLYPNGTRWETPCDTRCPCHKLDNQDVWKCIGIYTPPPSSASPSPSPSFGSCGDVCGGKYSDGTHWQKPCDTRCPCKQLENQDVWKCIGIYYYDTGSSSPIPSPTPSFGACGDVCGGKYSDGTYWQKPCDTRCPCKQLENQDVWKCIGAYIYDTGSSSPIPSPTPAVAACGDVCGGKNSDGTYWQMHCDSRCPCQKLDKEDVWKCNGSYYYDPPGCPSLFPPVYIGPNNSTTTCSPISTSSSSTLAVASATTEEATPTSNTTVLASATSTS